MSEHFEEPEATLQSLREENRNLQNLITQFRTYVELQVENIYTRLDDIKTIATAARDAAEDKAQEEEEEEDEFSISTPKRGKGKAKEEQTPRPTSTMGTSSGSTAFPFGAFPPRPTDSAGILGASALPREDSKDQEKPRTRFRSKTTEREEEEEEEPKEKKKKRYKVETPSKLKSIIPKDVKKWLMDVTVWAKRYEDEFDNEQDLVLHLFTLLDGETADWGFPFQGKLLLDTPLRPAPIQTLKEFMEGLIAAFGDPDVERAAARKLVELSQTGTAVEYTTKFRTIIADLNWNEAAYMGQYTRGLHWKVKEILSNRETQPITLQGLIDVAQRIDAVRRENEESRPKKEKTKEKGKNTSQGTGSTTKEKVADKENFVDREERDRRRKEGLCIKCGESGHNIKECPNGWRKSKLKKEEKREVKKESAKIAQDKPEEIEIEAESGKE